MSALDAPDGRSLRLLDPLDVLDSMLAGLLLFARPLSLPPRTSPLSSRPFSLAAPGDGDVLPPRFDVLIALRLCFALASQRPPLLGLFGASDADMASEAEAARHKLAGKGQLTASGLRWRLPRVKRGAATRPDDTKRRTCAEK